MNAVAAQQIQQGLDHTAERLFDHRVQFGAGQPDRGPSPGQAGGALDR